MAENVFDETPEADGSVSLTLKAGGKHGVPWLVLRYESPSVLLSVLKGEGPEIAEIMQLSSDMAISFDKLFEKTMANPTPPSRTVGKPKGADKPSNDELPFANAKAPEEASAEAAAPTCDHGGMQLVKAGGKTGYICSKPKGDPERCATVFV